MFVTIIISQTFVLQIFKKIVDREPALEQQILNISGNHLSKRLVGTWSTVARD